ncbi:hypothetical protein [Pseudoduganella sp. RAF53_2]|uniref:hypothetical protein n=1 Tax=unclassified Pseudoduganella TaxID=2637179 RepID=UPI003F953929
MQKTIMALLALASGLACAQAQAGNWVVRVDGAGPLKIGMKFDTVNRVLGDHMERTPPPLRANGNCFYVRPADDPSLMLMFVDDVLRRVHAVEEGSASERGVAVGDSVEKVRQIYGEAVKDEPNAYDASEHYLTVHTGGGQYALRFETSKGRISALYAGDWRQVQWTEGCS